jgi:general stress protein 26
MEENKHKHLEELLRGLDTAMLMTRHGVGFHARPMAIAAVDGPTVLWFVTSDDSPKANEIRQDSFAVVTAQSDRKFLAMSGRGVLVKDRGKIDDLWKEAWKVWFPKGKSDPALCLIRMTVDDAEYWDYAGAKGIRYAFEAAKAYAKGETPKTDEGQHARVLPARGRPPTGTDEDA